jgi:hypothetical protein
MATFLKVVSGLYLLFVWAAFAMTLNMPAAFGATNAGSEKLLAFLIAVGLSIPAVALFAFGQVVGDVRAMRNNTRRQEEHLQAMRHYYEPKS